MVLMKCWLDYDLIKQDLMTTKDDFVKRFEGHFLAVRT